MDYYVYKHISKLTLEVFYIGKGRKRRAHSRNSRNRYWKNIANKEGYIVEFISFNLTEEESLRLEIELIAKFKPKANLSSGGRGGCTGIKRSKEELDRRSNTQRQQRNDPEWKAMNSRIQKEVQNRPEVREKRLKARRLLMEQIRAGIKSNPFKPKIWSPEMVEQIASKQRGSRGYWYGKTTAVAKKVINTENGAVFQSLKQAAESVNGVDKCLTRAIKAGRKFKKVKFEFYKG